MSNIKKILELGCGEGLHLSTLAKNKSNLTVGIDLSTKDIQTAKKRYPHISFRVMSAEDLRFNKNSFDEIYALDVIEHVTHLDKCLKECKRVLKRGGKFVINIPAEKSEKWLLKVRPTYFKEIHHVRVFENTQLEQLLSKYGFKSVSRKPKGFLQHVELYYLFKTTKPSSSQLSIGRWRDSPIALFIGVSMGYFNSDWVFSTFFRFIPLWIFTLPIAYPINFFGNRIFPKSIYHEFVKI